MASILMPNEGTAKAWITSAPVTCTRTTLLTGTTISLSTASRRGWPGLSSLSLQHQRVELELAVVRIGVGPVPLLAGRLDGQVGRRGVELVEQEAERRDRDRHQDQHRHHRPGHLEQRVVGGPRRRRIGARVELARSRSPAAPARTAVISVMIQQQEVVEPDDVVHHRRRRPAAGRSARARAGRARHARHAVHHHRGDDSRRDNPTINHLHRRHRSLSSPRNGPVLRDCTSSEMTFRCHPARMGGRDRPGHTFSPRERRDLFGPLRPKAASNGVPARDGGAAQQADPRPLKPQFRTHSQCA